MKNYSEKVSLKEYWKDEKAKKKRLQDWGSANDNFGGYYEDIGWKVWRGWCPGSGEYPVIARWRLRYGKLLKTLSMIRC